MIGTSFAFGTRMVGPGQPTLVIAEIGINHEGDPTLCAWMIEAAARAGADAVKLQIINAAENYAPGTESHTLFSKAWLPPDRVAAAFIQARDLGIEAFATVGDLTCLEWVARLKPAGYKISSGLLTHHPLIAAAARTGAPLILSSGMSDAAEVDEALDVARASGATGLGLLHCTSIYPAPPELLDLAAIPALAARTGVTTGFSDHSVGDVAAQLAVALGATIVEKHFTLDTGRESYDHRLSLDPGEFARFVAAIRRAEVMRGEPVKTLSEAEREMARKSRRVLAARRPIPAGTRLTVDDIGFFRLPADARRGFEPKHLSNVLGRVTTAAVPAYAALLPEHLAADHA